MQDRDVLVPVDFSAASLCAIECAVEQAGEGGQVYLLHVVDTDFVARVEASGLGRAEALVDKLRQEARERMEAIVAACPATVPRIDSLVVAGKPYGEILKMARELDFDMIVLATHGKRAGEVESLLFGTTTEKVLRGAQSPVLCVPPALRGDGAVEGGTCAAVVGEPEAAGE